jgi:hypothetical protein
MRSGRGLGFSNMTNAVLGSRLNQPQKARIVATATAERKFATSSSYWAATRLEVLEPAEGVLDEVSVAIAGTIMANRSFAAGAAKDHGHGAGLSNGSAPRIGLVSLVGEDVASTAGTRE